MPVFADYVKYGTFDMPALGYHMKYGDSEIPVFADYVKYDTFETSVSGFNVKYDTSDAQNLGHHIKYGIVHSILVKPVDQRSAKS